VLVRATDYRPAVTNNSNDRVIKRKWDAASSLPIGRLFAESPDSSELIVISTRAKTLPLALVPGRAKGSSKVQRLVRLVRGSEGDGNDNDRYEKGRGIARRDNSWSCDNCGYVRSLARRG